MNLKSLYLAMAMVATTSFLATAQNSIISAPIPTHSPDIVKSAFCDVYTPFTKFDRQHGATMDTITVNSSDNVLKFQDNYVTISLGECNLNDMEYMHTDVYSPSVGGVSQVRFGFAFFSSGEKYADAYYNIDTPANQWTSIDIPLSAFGEYDFNNTQVLRMTVTKTPGNIFYMDNVYFYTTKKQDGGSQGQSILEIPIAPVPTQPDNDVKAFFSDAYPSLFGKFEITTYGEGKVEIIDQSDDQQVCCITDFNWVPINLGSRNVADKGYVHFDFYTPADDAVTSINVGFQNWNATDGSAYEIEGEDFNYRILTLEKWNSFDIPLSNFINFDFSSQMAVLRLRKGGSGKTLYVDNVYFWGKPGENQTNPSEFDEIKDDSDGELPPMDTPMLGVNLASASGGSIPGAFGYDYMYPRLNDLWYFKAKGVRLIRLPFRADRFVEDIKNPTTDYENDSTSDFAALKGVVAEAERLGMWIFLDAHDYAERTIDGTSVLLGEGEYTIERFAKMWGTIAAEFKNYDNIWGYDLQNEPKVDAQTLVKAYQAAIDEIRKTDIKAQIIVEGTGWASAYEWIYGNRSDKQYPEYSTEVAWSYKQNSPWLLADLKDPQNKIVYEAHGYFDGDNSGTYKEGYSEVDYRNRFLPFLEWCRTNNYKGLIGEFGVPYNEHSAGDPRYMDVLDGALNLFREYQVNATYWCAGAMYESNLLSCQPDKNPIYGNYAKEKSTMKVLEKYFNNWVANKPTGIEKVDYEHHEDGRTYNLMGIEVDESYKGIVIRNGRKLLQK